MTPVEEDVKRTPFRKWPFGHSVIDPSVAYVTCSSAFDEFDAIILDEAPNL